MKKNHLLVVMAIIIIAIQLSALACHHSLVNQKVDSGCKLASAAFSTEEYYYTGEYNFAEKCKASKEYVRRSIQVWLF